MKEYLPFLALPIAFLGIIEINKKTTNTTGTPLTKTEEAMEIVERFLKSKGWREIGYTESKTFKIITRKTYPLSGALITTGGKPRYERGKWRVTIGKRNTHFYKPEKGKDYTEWAGEWARTKDIKRIEEIERNIELG